MTKSLLFSIYLSCASLFCFSQSNYNGRILDLDNSQPLNNVRLIYLSTNDTLYSNEQGFFKISANGNYLLQNSGYLDKTVYLNNNEFSIIELKPDLSQLDEVIINANHLPKPLRKASASITIVNSQDIERANNINFAPALNRVPGLFMQSGALNTNRITIRGIGSRNLFGTSKIRAYFKDIPLTNGSGETNIEDFELASIANMEIIKGATSSSFGAGLGGTIILRPLTPDLQKSTISSEFTTGSFGLQKGLINLNLGLKNHSFRAVYSDTHSDGFRENNEYDRQTLTLNSAHYINGKNDVSFFGSYVNLKAFIPSSINETDYFNNPETAAFTWKQSQGFEDANRGIFGLSWNHQYTEKLQQKTSVFTSFRDGYEPRPFNILIENSFAFGLRSRILGHFKLFSNKLNYTVGGEIFRDNYKSKTFENLYEDFPQGTGSVQGQKLSDFKEDRSYYNLFFETDYELSEKTTLSAGLNLNQTAYDLDDRFQVSDSNPDQSGNFEFKAILSPKLGVSHFVTETITFFTSLSHGFSPISLNETLLPDGQINTNLKPETGWNFEIGSRGSLLNNRLNFSTSIYRLDIKNLVVSRRTAQDQFIGVNAGRTKHDGFELSLDYNWFQDSKFRLNSFLTYTLNNFKFQEFIDDSNDFSGNDLTGVPKQVLNTGLDFDTDFGIFGNVNFQFVDDIPITDSNSLYADAYSLTNLKLGYKTALLKKLNVQVFFGINNIFDTDYASQILINATGFGGAAPRYYYPGNPLNYYSGLQLNYVF